MRIQILILVLKGLIAENGKQTAYGYKNKTH